MNRSEKRQVMEAVARKNADLAARYAVEEGLALPPGTPVTHKDAAAGGRYIQRDVVGVVEDVVVLGFPEAAPGSFAIGYVCDFPGAEGVGIESLTLPASETVPVRETGRWSREEYVPVRVDDVDDLAYAHLTDAR